MGEVVVSGLVTLVKEKLSSKLSEEFDLFWGFKDSVKSIKDDFVQIEAVLEDAEKKCNQDKEKAVELWLMRLRSASLEIENVLDEISTEAKLRQLREERGVFRCWTMVSALFTSNQLVSDEISTEPLLQRIREERGVYRFWAMVSAFFTSNQLVFRFMMAHKVKDIKKKLDDIVLQSQRFDLRLTPSSSARDTGVVGVMPDRETFSLIHNSSEEESWEKDFFGRKKDVEMVIKKICNNNIGRYDNREILVYGIYGMGGLGKTTLAQLVYNHQTVNQYFDLKCWVYVSKNFQVLEIIKKIMESLGGSNEATQLETLQSSLQDMLSGKRFLVVLDDVWIEEKEKTKWEKLSKILSCGKDGSIVVMTTRYQSTSKMMAKVPELQHELGCLSEDDSWLLFTNFAFAQGRKGDDMSLLEPIGKEIVERCKGLPLAVKTIGSLMWSKGSANEWRHVQDSIQWELQESKVLPALKLSYANLLPHLKRCFAYCCLFPKGYEMEKDDVIQLWVSNGFIPPRGELDLYVLGEESFNCLLWRSFFQVHEQYIWGDTYKMHDLMHDMAAYVMRHDCLVMDPARKDVKIPNEVLHLSSSCPDFLFPPHELQNLTQLRSLLMLGVNINSESHISQIFNHVYLRVLHLPCIDLKTLPESICNLKLLKYLNLLGSEIVALPESIIYLQNLQELVLSECAKLSKLPEGLRYMRGLQHLAIHGCRSLKHLPVGVKKLSSLRRLSDFPVGKKEISGAIIEELGDLNHLEGGLKISRLENVEGLSEAKSANLKSKTNLLDLSLEWSEREYYGVSDLEMVIYEEVLEGLEANVCLEGLEINYYKGKIISPSWMVSLTNLVRVTFSHCRKCEHIPALGRLPNLRFIRLRNMDSFKYFHDNEKNTLRGTTNMFLSLKELIILECPNLVSLPSNLPKLRKLKLEQCGKLLSLPEEIQSFKDLNELHIDYGCKHLCERYEEEKGVDWPKISHIRNIKIFKGW